MFSQRLRIVNQNVTRLLYVYIYSKLLNFIQLSLNLTELCHIMKAQPPSKFLHLYFSLRANCTDFIAEDEWPSNSLYFNPLDYHVWGAMLQAFHKLHSKPKNIPELKRALQQIWDDLPQTTIDEAINDFHKRLNACLGRWRTF